MIEPAVRAIGMPCECCHTSCGACGGGLDAAECAPQSAGRNLGRGRCQVQCRWLACGAEPPPTVAAYHHRERLCVRDGRIVRRPLLWQASWQYGAAEGLQYGCLRLRLGNGQTQSLSGFAPAQSQTAAPARKLPNTEFVRAGLRRDVLGASSPSANQGHCSQLSATCPWSLLLLLGLLRRYFSIIRPYRFSVDALACF